MNLHPAYPQQGHLDTFHGFVVSAFEATSEALSLRLVTSYGIQAAWLPKEAVLFQVARGQVWDFTGEIVDLKQYGEQLKIRRAVPSMPAGRLIVPFLAHHIPGLSRQAAQRMWEAFDHELVTLMEQGDVTALACAVGGSAAVQLATMTVHTWADWVAYTELAQQLYQYDFNEKILRMVVTHYGQRSLAQVRDDPYRLLAFSELAPVDCAAQTHFMIRKDDQRRLLGIVDAAVHQLYGRGVTIFPRVELEATILDLTDLQCRQVANAIALALQHGRLVAANERHLMGDGFAQIEQTVIQFLVRCSRALHEPNAILHSAPTVSRPVLDAVSVQVSITLTYNEDMAFSFVKSVADYVDSRSTPCHVLAGSESLCQRIRAATALHPMTLLRAPDELSDFSKGLRPRAIVVMSSTIDFVDMARLLPKLHPKDQLFFVGQPLRGAGDRTLLLPALLMTKQIFRHDLSLNMNDDVSPNTVHQSILASNAPWSRYLSRESGRQGVFWMSVADVEFERAVAGISHQLCRHGSVAVVVRDDNERRQYTRLITAAIVSDYSTGKGPVQVETADRFEPADSDSSLVVLRQPGDYSSAWLRAAIGTAASRVVIVSTVEIDHQLSTMQEMKPVWDGFANRWDQVWTNHAQKGQFQ